MKFSNLIWYAGKRLKRDRILHLLMAFSMLLTIFFAQHFIYVSKMLSYNEDMIRGSLVAPASRYGAVMYESNIDSFAEITAFFDKLKDIDEIERIGALGSFYDFVYDEPDMCDLNEWGKMLEHRQIIQTPGEDDYLGFTGIDIDSGEFGLYNLRLKSGKPPEEYDVPENCELIYLGADFSDIQVGTRFTWNEKWGGYTQIVAGIFEEGSILVDEDYIYNSGYEGAGGGLASEFVLDLDDEIVTIADQGDTLCSLNSFLSSEGYTSSEVRDRINEVASDNNVSVFVSTLDERLDVVMSNSRRWEKDFARIAIASLIITLVSGITMCVIRAILRKNEISIWRVNGFGRRDVFFVSFLENLSMSFSAAVISSVLIYVYEMKYYSADTFKWLKHIFFRSIVWGFAMAVFMAAVVSAVTVRLIVSKNISSDIRRI